MIKLLFFVYYERYDFEGIEIDIVLVKIESFLIWWRALIEVISFADERRKINDFFKWKYLRELVH